MNPSVLVVEDDRALCDLLTWNLSAEGYDVRSTGDGEEALVMVREQHPDAIILDWMIEQVPGIEVCRQLRKDRETAQIPIVMLTARGEEEDRIRGLDTGADDYVVKPYSIKELMARVRSMLRRTRPASVGQTLEYRDIVLDPLQHKVTRAGKFIKLGPTEFRLLVTLLEMPGRVWSRDQLLDRVWGRTADVDLRTVDVHVGRLRKALREHDKRDPIRTVRGFGYALDQD